MKSYSDPPTKEWMVWAAYVLLLIAAAIVIILLADFDPHDLPFGMAVFPNSSLGILLWTYGLIRAMRPTAY